MKLSEFHQDISGQEKNWLMKLHSFMVIILYSLKTEIDIGRATQELMEYLKMCLARL